jgi:hypothetical protein
MALPKKKIVSSGTITEPELTAPSTSRPNEETLPPIQGQPPPPQAKNQTLENTTQQEPAVEPTLMEVLAQLKAVEKAKGKISAQVAAKRKEAQEAKQLADAKRKLAEMQAELDDPRRAQKEFEQEEKIPSDNQTTNHYTENHSLPP